MPTGGRGARGSRCGAIEHGEGRPETGLDRTEDRHGNAAADRLGDADEARPAEDHRLRPIFTHSVEGGVREHVMGGGGVRGDLAPGRATARIEAREAERPRLVSSSSALVAIAGRR